jgi:hypothetical protein
VDQNASAYHVHSPQNYVFLAGVYKVRRFQGRVCLARYFLAFWLSIALLFLHYNYNIISFDRKFPNSSMKFSGTIIFVTVIPIATIFAFSQRSPIIDVKRMHALDVITRNVCIIRSSASGTYGAIRLNDLGKSVVVVEQQSELGGQTETYTDPASGNKT